MAIVNIWATDPPQTAIRADSIVSLMMGQPWVFGAHAHCSHHQLLWLNKGAGRVLLDGAMRGLTPNTAVFVPAGRVHELSLSNVAMGWVITFPVALPATVPLPKVPRVLPVPERAEQASLTALCDEIHREQLAVDLGQEAALASRAVLLAVWLARRLEGHVPSAGTPSAQQILMSRFMQAMEERHITADTASDYAEALGVTLTHLSRVTRAVTGKPVTTLLQERKLLAACEGLAYSQERVGALAERLGFASPAYFARLFAQRMGVAPSAFRQKGAAPPKRALHDTPSASG